MGIVQNGALFTMLALDTQESRPIRVADLDSTVFNIDFPAHIPGTDNVLLTVDLRGCVPENRC